jgi:hypothetical protein
MELKKYCEKFMKSSWAVRRVNIKSSWFIIKVRVTDLDDGDRASHRNVDFLINIDAADRPRGFYNAHVPWKFQILHCEKVLTG